MTKHYSAKELLQQIAEQRATIDYLQRELNKLTKLKQPICPRLNTHG